MDEAAASELVDLARGDPRAAFDRAERALRSEAIDDAVAAVILRALGTAARWARTVDESVALLQESIRRARAAGRGDLEREAQLTMAGSQYMAGEAQAALSTLTGAAEAAERSADKDMIAKIEFQRATIMAREGHAERALASFGRALEYFEACGDDLFVARTLGNRGMVHLERGNARAADSDLRQAQQRFAKLGVRASAASMEHNLGRADAARGDVLGALNRFRRSEEELSGLIERLDVNRSEILLQAGLFEEAEGVAAQAEEVLAAGGLEVDLAEAVLTSSLALLGQHKYAAAAEKAQHAASLFAPQRREAWVLQANVVELRSLQAAGIPLDAAWAATVANELTATGQLLAAAQAWAVVADSEPDQALDAVRSLDLPHREAPLEFRLTELDIVARACLAHGDRSGALAATMSAIELGRRHQLTLGAADIRAAISAQLDAIAQLGLRIRRESNRPWDVVRWVDRSRSASLHARASSLEASSEVGDLLAELRAVQVAARAAEPADTVPLLQQQARLQRRLAQAQRFESKAAARAPQCLPRDVRAACAGATIIQHHRDGNRLGAVVIDEAGARIVDLAPLDDIDTEAAYLDHRLGRLILGRGAALSSVQRHAELLSELVVPQIDRRPTVVIPLPQHAGIPWSLLPALTDRTVTVAPNLRHWLGPGTAPARPTRSATSVGIIEGPDLTCASIEAAGIRRVWDQAEWLPEGQATVTAALQLLQRAQIVHLACHCHRRSRDGRFAQLRLGDGDLTAFDLERLDRAPQVVVMAACEAGLVDTLPGEESTGLATALFGQGTETIIGATVLLPDTPSTAELFVDLHGRLAAGRRPSAALFEAQQARSDPAERVIAQAVSCFGRG